MIFIYIGVDYIDKATGKTAVAVTCEQCGRQYYFEMTRVVSGRIHSPFNIGAETARQRAREQAKRRLQRVLAEDIDAVPCPECGWYQKAMLPILRYPRLAWICYVAFGCVPAAAVLFGAGLIYFMCVANHGEHDDLAVAWLASMALLLLSIPALLVLRWVLNRRYDPNKSISLDERLSQGRGRAISRELAEGLMRPEED